MAEETKKITLKLLDESEREKALEDIIASIDKNPSYASSFWESDELIITILQYLTKSFFILNTPQFGESEIKKVRVCLDILSKISLNTDITDSFLRMQLDFYIYPYLMATVDESLKISALVLFSSLLREGLPERMKSSELLPLLLKIIDSDSEKCQILALETLDLIFVGGGLDYAVQTLDRFQAIDVVLNSLIKKSISAKKVNFLEILIKIYIRLCDKPNVTAKLREKLPEILDYKELREVSETNKELGLLRTTLINIFKS